MAPLRRSPSKRMAKAMSRARRGTRTAWVSSWRLHTFLRPRRVKSRVHSRVRAAFMAFSFFGILGDGTCKGDGRLVLGPIVVHPFDPGVQQAQALFGRHLLPGG